MRSRFLVVLLAAGLSACTVGGRGDRRPRSSGPGCPPSASLETKPIVEDVGRIPGSPSLRVIWEALYVEQEQLRNSRFRASGLNTFGTDPILEVILLNASFHATPEQDKDNRSQVAVGRVARVPDQDMLDLLRELDGLGFFKYAKPTSSVEPFFASDQARGRITIERDGESWTLVSQRGLGLQTATREIPGIYAAAKDAIQRLKNRTPAMSVKRAKVDAADPRAMKSSGAAGSGSGTGSR